MWLEQELWLINSIYLIHREFHTQEDKFQIATKHKLLNMLYLPALVVIAPPPSNTKKKYEKCKKVKENKS